MRRLLGGRALVALLGLAALVAAGCGDGGSGGDGPTVAVGSANFAENEILAEVFAQALAAEGIPVETRLQIGSREVYEPALSRAEIDVMPEYLSAALIHLGGEGASDPATAHERLREAFAEQDVVVLDYADAQNQDAFAVRRETSENLGLETVSDLQPVSDQLVFGGPPECPERRACLLGLEEVYGITEWAEIRTLEIGGPIFDALENEAIDVGLVFTTDAAIAARDFVVLEDDRELENAQNIVPVASQEVVDAYGEDLTGVLNAIVAELATDQLRDLNARVQIDNEDPANVAADWLAEHGFVEEDM